jgi:hypothetical protein
MTIWWLRDRRKVRIRLDKGEQNGKLATKSTVWRRWSVNRMSRRRNVNVCKDAWEMCIKMRFCISLHPLIFLTPWTFLFC